MQQTGCLKKRRRRNLTKVTGLSLIPYDETTDNYRGLDLYGPSSASLERLSSVSRDTDSCRITMSRLHESRRSGTLSSSTRITRDPTFSDYFGDLNNSSNNFDDYNRPPDNYSKRQQNLPQEVVTDRPYLLDKKILKKLRQVIWLGLTSWAIPWYWNKETHRIDRWNSTLEKIWSIVWFLMMIQTIGLTGFQFYAFGIRLVGNIVSYRPIFQAFLSVFWYVCALYFNLNLYLYREPIRLYINTLLTFNKVFVDRYLVSDNDFDYQGGGRILLNLSIPVSLAAPGVSVALFLIMPFQPWYLYSYIYSPENPWYWLIPGALQELMIVGQCLTSYMLIAWVIVAHTNSVDFWLKEIHNNNDTGYTISSIREPKFAVETYRSLQILNTCFNDCMAPLAIPCVKIHIITGIIPCAYVLIRSINDLFFKEFPGILTYPLGILNCSSVAFAMMSMAAEMHDLGIGFVDSWSQTRQKDFRRVLTSLPALKVKVGRFYYITVSTTIKFFQVTIGYVIDCIVTFQ